MAEGLGIVTGHKGSLAGKELFCVACAAHPRVAPAAVVVCARQGQRGGN